MAMTLSRRTLLVASAGITAALLLAAPSEPTEAQGSGVLVFAAASLKNALDAVNAQWTKETGKKAVISYASSPALARQIEQGAPAQMFISADLDWMDYLARKEPHQAGYALQPARQSHRADRTQGQGAAGRDQAWLRPCQAARRRTPVDGQRRRRPGRQVRQGCAWRSSGVWAGVSGKIAQAENVRAALLLVSRGEAPAGIVYQTDAAADPDVKIIGTFPEDTHPPIIYPIALTADAAHPDADRVPRLHQIGQGQAPVPGAGVHRARPGAVLTTILSAQRAEAIRAWTG